MFVYFAQPIDQALHGLGSGAAERIRSTMVEAAISYFQPSRAYSLSEDRTGFDVDILDQINRAALAACDGLVAMLPNSVPTLGVPAEIEQAINMGKPTVIFTTRKLAEQSVQIRQWANRGATIRNFLIDPVQDAKRLLVDLHAKPDAEAANEPALLVKFNNGATPLKRAYPGDAGLDLAISEEAALADGEYKLISTGVRAAVPHGWWGFMHGRSSAWAKLGLEVKTAVIDSGYRGELMIGVTNRSGKYRYLVPGTRLAQYVLMPVFMGPVVEVDELPDHERGENGYGSSGR